MSNDKTGILQVDVNQASFVHLVKTGEIRHVFAGQDGQIPLYWTPMMLQGVASVVMVRLDPTLEDPILSRMVSAADRPYHERNQPAPREWAYDGSRLVRYFGGRPAMERTLAELGVDEDQLKKVKSLKVGQIQEQLDQSTDEEQSVIVTLKTKGDQFTFNTSNENMKIVKLSTTKIHGNVEYKLTGEIDLKKVADRIVKDLQTCKVVILQGGTTA